MTAFYITADVVGGWSGGSQVTAQEYEALKQLGIGARLFDRKFMEEVIRNQTPPQSYLSLPCSYNSPKPLPPDPWLWDEVMWPGISLSSDSIDVAHFYAGTFSKTVAALRELNPPRRCLISYTAAAHDIDASRRAHLALDLPFDYPHLNEPELWNKYVQGYVEADLVICPSRHSASQMQKYGCKRIEVIPHGIDLPVRVAPLPNSFRVGYLGAYTPDKGICYLLDAWKKLNYKDATLVLAGRDSTHPYVHHLVDKFGGGNIEFMGWVKDVGDFYNSISVYVQPSVCLLPGSPVYAVRGQIPIDELGYDDAVLTNDGTYKKVIKPTKRRYEGELVSLRTIGFGASIPMTPAHRVLVVSRGTAARASLFQQKLKTYEEVMELRREGLGSRRISNRTGVHPQTIEQWFRGSKPHDGHCGLLRSLREDVLHSNPEWKAARDVEKDDAVLFPRIKENERIDELSLPQKVGGVSGNHTSPLPPTLILDEDALLFMGYYIAEGCAACDESELIWSFHEKEINYGETVCRVLQRLGLRPRWNNSRAGKKSFNVCVGSALLWRFLVTHFGRGAHNKTLPMWSLRLPPDQLQTLLRGAWRGDGTVWGTAEGRRSVSYSTVSKSLAHQLFACLVKLGYMPKINFSSSNNEFSVGCNGDDVARFMDEVMQIKVSSVKGQRGCRTYIDDDFYYMPVTGVSRIAYSGDVYNLEVEENHCYAAPFIVHNSEGFGIEVLEAMAHRRPVICSMGAGAVDLLREPPYIGSSVPACDAVKLSEEIDSARTQWKLQTIGEQARHKAELHTWDKIRQRYIDLWRGLLKDG